MCWVYHSPLLNHLLPVAPSAMTLGVLLKKYSEPLGSTNWRMRHPNRNPSSSNPERREGHASAQWRTQRKIPQSIFKKQLKLKCSFEIVSLTHLIADYFPRVSPILCVAWWLAGCWRDIFQETRRRKVLLVANMHKMLELSFFSAVDPGTSAGILSI